ncbi:MAG: type II toxin-antitoxin system RelE/ParE family toxin [Alphaproteobacteria bacterium]|nr:type II toxin-antitoxin system RelE/ParE family toxin [Alphaproteobacteria bacterium]
MLALNLSKDAIKFLAKLPQKHARQVVEKIQNLRLHPFPQDSKTLKGYLYYRADSGENRIIYEVIKTSLDILIIGKRNDDAVYKKLKNKKG